VGPRALSRVVGFVFQDPAAQFVVDVVEAEIAFALENAGLPPAEMRQRVEEVLDLLDLARLRDRPLEALSGGERQRVAIAAALALRPPLLVLDEPTSQLDPQAAEELLQALVRLNEELGLTVVLAEHRLDRVLRYVDRMVYLPGAGLPLIAGAPRAVLAQSSLQPPLVRLGLTLDWQPLPLTIKEALPFAQPQRAAFDAPSATAPPDANGSAYTAPQVPALEVRDLHFARGRQEILRGVSLQVRPGEAVALLGRNGSGKTTLLKCVVGLLRPQRGKLLVAGQATTGRAVAEICRDVAYLPQDPDDLLFADTVADELRTTLHNHGRRDEGAVAALLARLGLAEVGHVYPRDLSVGQRQRVALGAVSVTTPPLLLLDEPTRGLDYTAKQALVSMWRSWLAAGAGLLLVTHDVELAASVAERVVVVSQGEVIADGPVREVLPPSPVWAPQVARLFPGTGWLTVEDALAGKLTR
jgi:energy-coupling factor transport system ATP-binding protein